jgi:hypothetical protein
MSHRLAAGRKASVAVAACKDLEVWYWIVDGLKVGGYAKGETKGSPDVPVGAGCCGSVRYDSGAHRVLNNAEIVAESMEGRRMHRDQGVG